MNIENAVYANATLNIENREKQLRKDRQVIWHKLERAVKAAGLRLAKNEPSPSKLTGSIYSSGKRADWCLSVCVEYYGGPFSGYNRLIYSESSRGGRKRIVKRITDEQITFVATYAVDRFNVFKEYTAHRECQAQLEAVRQEAQDKELVDVIVPLGIKPQLFVAADGSNYYRISFDSSNVLSSKDWTLSELKALFGAINLIIPSTTYRLGRHARNKRTGVVGKIAEAHAHGFSVKDRNGKEHYAFREDDWTILEDVLEKNGWKYEGCGVWQDPQTRCRYETVAAYSIVVQQRERKRTTKGL